VKNAALKLVLCGSALSGILLFSLVLNKFITTPRGAFLTTSSPNGTYRVDLTGQKERPLFFTVEVRFHVLRKGSSFVSNEFLHSGDSEDLSFEVGYPNHRWIDERTIQFYREQFFNDTKPEPLVVVNNSHKTIKYARVDSVDKFLVFDLEPGSSTKMLTSRPRGDAKWVGVVGEFSDGTKVPGDSLFLRSRKESNGPITYCLRINDDQPTFGACDQESVRVQPAPTNPNHSQLPFTALLR